MEKKVVHRRRPREADYGELMRRNGGSLLFGDAAFRNMLDNVCPRCYVEAEETRQHGEVTGVIRDRYGVPVALKVRYEDSDDDGATVEGDDYIAVSDITFWEPFNHWVPDENYIEGHYEFDHEDEKSCDGGGDE